MQHPTTQPDWPVEDANGNIPRVITLYHPAPKDTPIQTHGWIVYHMTVHDPAAPSGTSIWIYTLHYRSAWDLTVSDHMIRNMIDSMPGTTIMETGSWEIDH